VRNTITKKKIYQIQNFVIKILRQSSGKRRSLKELSQDNCSELSRLVVCFILESWQGVVVRVVKGTNVCGIK
jgi:hypothetical protein